jgi:hypothetical protein
MDAESGGGYELVSMFQRFLDDVGYLYTSTPVVGYSRDDHRVSKLEFSSSFATRYMVPWAGCYHTIRSSQFVVQQFSSSAVQQFSGSAVQRFSGSQPTIHFRASRTDVG